jgi:DNA-binding MarR family transcriptional regulator
VDTRAQAAERIDVLLRGILRGLHARDKAGEPDPDITLGQLHCLRRVGRLGAPTMGDLAQHLDLSPSTVTGLVDALVERGLVERQEDAEDRRIVRVGLTAEGRRGRDRRFRSKQQRLAQAFATLDDADLERVESALQLLRDAVARVPEGDGPIESRDES